MSRILILDSEERRSRAVSILGRLPIKPAIQVTIEEYDPARSAQQNRRYWMLLRMISKHVGHDEDEIHDFMKEKFLGTRLIEIAGERARVSPSTRKLKVKDFSAYMEKVESWAIEEIGIWLE